MQPAAAAATEPAVAPVLSYAEQARLWAARGRDRSSGGGAMPDLKRVHIPPLALKASITKSPKSKPPTAKPSPRQRLPRAAHTAGTPRDEERYAADGLARRTQRLGQEAPSQTN